MDESKLEEILEVESLREYKRHNIESSGRIECVYINGQPVKLRRFPTVEVKDVSASGIRIKAGLNEFRIGHRFMIRYKVGENQLTGIYEVVRTLNRKETSSEYGCRYVVDEEAKLEEERMWVRYTDDAPKMTLEAYTDILKAQEEQYGYLAILEQIKNGVEAVELAKKVRELIEQSPDTFLLNVIHQPRQEEESEYRHQMNIVLLSLMMWIWLELPLEEEPALVEDILKGKEHGFYHELIHVVESYDKRAAYPVGNVSGIPLSYLEQVYYEGLDDKRIDSDQKLRNVLSKNILRILKRNSVLLNDTRIGKIEYMFRCDCSHPVLTVGHESFQQQEAWGIVGLV